MKKTLLIILLAVAAAPANGGSILNTLTLAEGDRPGWSGSLEGILRASGGNTGKFLAEAGGQIRRRGDGSLLRFMAAGTYEETAGASTERNLTAHLRHNRDLGPKLQTVALVQVQHNPFQRLQSRWLLGAGLRWNLAEDPRGTVALGATPMLEVERIEDRAGHLGRGRLSTFLILGWNLREGVRMEGSGFYQPLFSDFGRARAVGNLGLRIALSGSLALKTGAAFEHNSEPPAGVEKTDWSTYSGFAWGF